MSRVNKINKLPSHWPHVSREQQFEGFKSAINNVNISPFELHRRLMIIVRSGIMNKSRMYTMMKWFRQIKGISYSQYIRDFEAGRERNRLAGVK
jgi:hypothetical protein